MTGPGHDVTDLRDTLLQVAKLCLFTIAVDVFGIGVMSWKHMGDALIGLVLGLVLTVGALCATCHRIGALGHDRP